LPTGPLNALKDGGGVSFLIVTHDAGLAGRMERQWRLEDGRLSTA